MPDPSARMDENLKSAPSNWGNACSQCAYSKVKCLRTDPAAGRKCDRCHRLNKDCAEKVQKKRKKRIYISSRTRQIEERLNTLIDSLQASTTLTSHAADAGSHGERADSDLVLSLSDAPLMESNGPLMLEQIASRTTPPQATTNVSPAQIPETYNYHAPCRCICRPVAGEVAGISETDEDLLKIYRNTLARVYPFVVIPDQVTAKEMQATRPFLMACIRMVASFRSMRSVQGQMFRLMSHVSEHVLMRSERSLDLLSGIVIMLGWYHHHCVVHSQMHNLLSLAMTLTAELGLKRNPSWQERTVLMVVNLGQVKERTNEERRLLVAVWFLGSCINAEFHKLETMKFSYYIKKCLRELELAEQYESDLYLVHLVRLQELSERIMQLRYEAEQGPEDAAKAPLYGYMHAFKAELEGLRSNIPHHLKDNYLLKTRLNTVLLRLNEPPKPDMDLITSLSNSLTVTAPFSSPCSPLDGLYSCNEALKTWFDEWFSIDVSEYISLPLPILLDITYAITILGRWAKFVTPDSIRFATGMLPDDPSGFYNSAASETTTPGSDNLSLFSSIEKDEGFVQAIKTLRTQLSTQPGLDLDVAGLLHTLGRKLEQANVILAARGEGAESWKHSIWALGAIKIRIVQSKLEQWTHMLSEDFKNGNTKSTDAAKDIQDTGISMVRGDPFEPGSWTTNMMGPLPLLEYTYENINVLSIQMDQDWGLSTIF
ncbi:uncharacterized protein FMAN_15501 [Fusarium mangiferae]|uniref:Zn(2)-C6 fungal-type domain-containing protein n=1 Tax=Fusarium mangiferae TaxID=192010 RepID=A0A1L7UNH3_FUSMA|nr:uncharacterized protein FMAN_15501 [Fusarium mangiferae]CVL09337.1 uncharacterized protein FMAN_15501 [Fusarium mangiferae]